MRKRLPVDIESRKLPVDEYNDIDKRNERSYGYVSVLYLSSLIITIISLLTVLVIWNR